MLPLSALVGILPSHYLLEFKFLTAEPDALSDHKDGIWLHQ